MTEDLQTTIDSGVELLHRLALENEVLRAEFEKSVGEFFPAGAPALGSPLEAITAARRHVEWFLFERWSPGLSDLPVEKLQEAFLAKAQDEQIERRDAFLNSFTGIFEVQEVVPGEGMRLEDLGGLQPVAAFEERGAESFEAGDLIVGRVYPLGDGIHHVSRAAALFRDPSLLAALKQDIERIRDSRDRAVFRIAQRELEAMFFTGAEDVVAPSSAGPDITPEDAIKKARESLVEHGLESEAVTRILDTLASSPPPIEKLVLGAGDVLGDLLDELAFETDVDLDLTRRVLLVAWRAMHEPSASAAEQPAKTATAPVVVNGIVQRMSSPSLERALGQTGGAPKRRISTDESDEVGPEMVAAVERFDNMVSSGGDLSSALTELEAELALEDAETEPETPIPNDFPDVVTAMIEEFLWEEGALQGKETARAYESLRALGPAMQHVALFEDLTREDIVSFLTVHVPEQGESLEDPNRLVQAVRRFCAWATENHELQQFAEPSFGEYLAAIQTSLPRTLELRSRFSATFKINPDATNEPERLGKIISNDGEALVVEGPKGRAARFELERAQVSTLDLIDELNLGDVVRVHSRDGVLEVESVLPPEAALLWTGALS